MVGWLT
jgi:hypothetical protein